MLGASIIGHAVMLRKTPWRRNVLRFQRPMGLPSRPITKPPPRPRSFGRPSWVDCSLSDVKRAVIGGRNRTERPVSRLSEREVPARSGLFWQVPESGRSGQIAAIVRPKSNERPNGSGPHCRMPRGTTSNFVATTSALHDASSRDPRCAALIEVRVGSKPFVQILYEAWS
jgi:hypothetical protein